MDISKTKSPKNWEDIVQECEQILGCKDHAQSPLMSNLPNSIRDLKINMHKKNAEQKTLLEDFLEEVSNKIKETEIIRQHLREEGLKLDNDLEKFLDDNIEKIKQLAKLQWVGQTMIFSGIEAPSSMIIARLHKVNLRVTNVSNSEKTFGATNKSLKVSGWFTHENCSIEVEFHFNIISSDYEYA